MGNDLGRPPTPALPSEHFRCGEPAASGEATYLTDAFVRSDEVRRGSR
jgi:hypothetical protein